MTVGGGALEIKDEEHTLNSRPRFFLDPLSACCLQDAQLTHCEHEGCHIYYAISSCRPPCGANCILSERLQDLL